MGTLVAVLNKNGENATQTAVAMLETMNCGRTEAFGIASPCTVKIVKNLEELQSLDAKSNVVIGHIFSPALSEDKPQPIQLDNATLVFEGRLFPSATHMPDAEVAARRLQQPRDETAAKLIKEVDGSFVFAVAENDRLVAGRDALGAQPLYYGENTRFVALASERKTLWKIGMENSTSFPPGHVAIANANGFTFNSAKTINHAKTKPLTMHAATQQLQKLLQQSVKNRVAKVREVAVAFSGGLDSSIIALLAKRSGAKINLVHVSLGSQSETEHAQRVANELELPIFTYEYSEADLKQALPAILWAIEEPDPIKTSIGIPVYWTAQRAAEMKLCVMLAGQGADELFGGYKRYVDGYIQCGKSRAKHAIANDIVHLYETNLERDIKICNACGIELRLPFVGYKLVKFALEMPVELKLEPRATTLRKLVLRRLAQNLGLPSSVVNRPKKAMQYSTGVNTVLAKLAKRESLTAAEYLRNVFRSTCRKMMRND